MRHSFSLSASPVFPILFSHSASSLIYAIFITTTLSSNLFNSSCPVCSFSWLNPFHPNSPLFHYCPAFIRGFAKPFWLHVYAYSLLLPVLFHHPSTFFRRECVFLPALLWNILIYNPVFQDFPAFLRRDRLPVFDTLFWNIGYILGGRKHNAHISKCLVAFHSSYKI